MWRTVVMIKHAFGALVILLATASAALATVPVPPVSVPEPSLLVLAGSGIAGVVLYARNRRRR
jgi:hypothetical protein